MTDGVMFYPLFFSLQENKIYYPKKNNADIYLNFIELNQNNNEFENAYQNYTKLYNKKEFDWMYYYVYIILFVDFESIINNELYEKIIFDIIKIYQNMNNNTIFIINDDNIHELVEKYFNGDIIIPPLSEWNTENITNMSKLFQDIQ